jgi:hypothetical protein
MHRDALACPNYKREQIPAGFWFRPDPSVGGLGSARLLFLCRPLGSRYRNATNAMTPARPRWRVLWCLAPLLPGLSFGDQPQLREEAVLAADEQAGARAGPAFGRQLDREPRDFVPIRAIVSGSADGAAWGGLSRAKMLLARVAPASWRQHR